jgi:hypothetical protein
MARRVLPFIVILPAIHLLLRIGFWYYNRGMFPGAWPQEAASVFFRGLQQDWASLIIANLPTILLLLWRMWERGSAVRNALSLAARICFITANILALALNCIDIGYFRFGHHRANLDLVYVLADSLPSFRNILWGYWPILLVFAGLVSVIVKLASFLPGAGKVSGGRGVSANHQDYANRRPSPPLLVTGQLALLALLIFSLGFPGRPVIPATPLLSVRPATLPLAQNSLLTWAYSVLHRSHELRPVAYFTRPTLDSIVTSSHRLLPGGGRQGFQKKNVVLFILESFSRCYVMPGDPLKASTPFLDSLIRKSLFFPCSFSNGMTSNQGIVSILGGLPALMDEAFYYSEYANTPLRSLGNILKDSGYSTNFLMGAPRDHFGFGKFAKMAGFDHEYWKNDFNDDRFYDGNWGIFDEPFLQYGARVLDRTPEPFLGAFFTISMHDPYTIPGQYRQAFDFPDKTPPQRVVSYTDQAFREFFSTCKQMPWFRNTLFVFCADHWIDPNEGRVPVSSVTAFTIPIFIYDPASDSGRRNATVAGQVDLAPTVLDLLGYRGPYTGFGRSLLDSAVADSDRYVVNKYGINYQVITAEYVYGFDPDRASGSYLYRYTTDTACRHDLLNRPAVHSVQQKLERLVKANIQVYRQALAARNLLSF